MMTETKTQIRKVPISAVMIVKNEHRHITEALETLHGWADEIIIVDDESTDDTRELAGKFTDKIFVHKMLLEGVQRNWGVSKASHDWVMFIDADERMTPELQQEINTLFDTRDEKTIAYWVPRKNYLGDRWLRHGGWYPAPHIKLYNKHHLKWKEVPADVVHPGIEIAPGYHGDRLKNHLIHYNFKHIDDFIAKVNRQSTLEAVKWHFQGKKISLAHGLWKSFDRFWRRFEDNKG